MTATIRPGCDHQRSLILPIRGACGYTAYGALFPGGGPTLAFCGEALDAVTCNYPLGNGRRFYSPVLMRFQSADALSPFGEGGLNAYAYCAADPINRVDPTGQAPIRSLRSQRSSPIISNEPVISNFPAAISGGAVVTALTRTANDVVKRHLGGVHDPLTHEQQAANTALFWSGVTGLAHAVKSEGTLMEPMNWSSSSLSIAATVLGNRKTVYDVATGLWATGLWELGRLVPLVSLDIAYQVTGVRQLVKVSLAGGRQLVNVSLAGGRQLVNVSLAGVDRIRGLSQRAAGYSVIE